MARRFLTKFIPNRLVQDEVATHLEDEMNALYEKGYDVERECREDGSYMLHAELRAPIREEEALGPPHEVEEDDGPCPFIQEVLSRLSAGPIDTARKQAVVEVHKLTVGMPTHRVTAIAQDCRESQQRHNATCVRDGSCSLGELCAVIIESLEAIALKSLS